MKKKIIFLSIGLWITCGAMGQTSVTLSPTKDNTIFSESGSLSNGQGYLFAGRTGSNRGNSLRRALFQFDLSGIPSSAIILEVELVLNVNRLNGGVTDPLDYSIHRVTKAWGEGSSNTGGAGDGATAVVPDATWTHAMYDAGTWSDEGGDYESIATATATFDGSIGNQTFTTSSELVAEIEHWRDGLNDNHGWILIGDETVDSSVKRIGSSEQGAAPSLTITYTIPITWDGSESNDWNTPENWDAGTVPTSESQVIIPNVANDPIIASGEIHEVFTLTVQEDARIDIGPTLGGMGSTLVVNNAVDNEGIISSNENSSFKLLGSYTTTKSESFTNSRTVYGDLSYSIFSVPFSDGNIDLFDAAFAYEYNNATGTFEAVAPSTSSAAGKGYFIAMSDGSTPGSGNTFTPVFAGTPIDEDVDVAISQAANDNFNLVGNPYTAAIGAPNFLANSNNMSNTTGVIYFWDDGGDNSGSDRLGDYITVNSMGAVGTEDLGDGTVGIKGESVYNGHITAMQGFFVEATANGDVSFTQDMQVTGNNANNSFYRITEDTRTKLKLSLVKGGIAKSTLIGFDEAATSGDDYSLDAKKFAVEGTMSISSLQGAKRYAIQALPELSGEIVTIPLVFDAVSKGSHQIRVNELVNLPDGYTVYLRDESTGISHRLNATSLIHFSTISTINDTRFSLSFQPGLIANVEEGFDRQLTLLAANANELKVHYLGAEEEWVSIYDLTGKVFYDQKMRFTDGQVLMEVSLTKNRIYMLCIAGEVIKFSLE